MKTITYNPETHRLVPVEPTAEMFAAANKIDDEMYCGGSQHGADIDQVYYAMLSAAPVFDTVEDNLQPEPVEAEPVAITTYVGYRTNDGDVCKRVEIKRLKYIPEHTLLYTAPPDYEEIKRQLKVMREQRDELVTALESIIVAANESDESWYGTLGTRFVRDIAEPALASVKTNVGSSDEQGGAA